MFASADEARDYYDFRISEKRDLVVECDIAISALQSAYDYIEGVLGETETGDLLPSASSYEIDLFDRQMMISDRIGEREEMRTRAEFSVEDLEQERDSVVADLEEREAEAAEGGDDDVESAEADEAAQYFDDVLGPVDNSGVHVYESEEEWAGAQFDEVVGPVDNSGVTIYEDEEAWARANGHI
ncbi:hypothetical protein [Cupriavidus nantongensis]